MSYLIVRHSKLRFESLSNLYRHIERKNETYQNKEIDKDKTHLNYSLKTPDEGYQKEVDKIAKEKNIKYSKSFYVACLYVITSDNQFFKKAGEEETKRFFLEAYNFVKTYKNLGEENIISANVHMDETTPHIHIVYVPVVKYIAKDGEEKIRISGSMFWQGRDSYRKLQDEFASYMQNKNFNIERSVPSKNKRLSPKALKEVLNFDLIKYELENEMLKSTTKDPRELVKQNEKLIEQVNKDKITITQLMSSMEYLSYVDIENQKLKEEKEKLREKIASLKTYIDNIYRVVNLEFDFPITSMKNIVRNFIEGMEKIK